MFQVKKFSFTLKLNVIVSFIHLASSVQYLSLFKLANVLELFSMTLSWTLEHATVASTLSNTFSAVLCVLVVVVFGWAVFVDTDPASEPDAFDEVVWPVPRVLPDTCFT